MVLAKRAVNAHLRTKSRVLILTFNITLRNYIHDHISKVREHFDWSNFYIIHYHLFFKIEANNYNLEFSNFLTDCDNEEFFESVKHKITKYDAILIDEIQDYKTEWIRIIKKYFLAENGEFVVCGDEKQNIFKRAMDADKRPNTGIPGRWNQLNQSFRLTTKIVNLALEFQKQFFPETYGLDILEPVPPSLFDNLKESIEYLFFDAATPEQELNEKILEKINQPDVHPNDIAVLSPVVSSLRELDCVIRETTGERTSTMFETKEIWEKLKEDFPNDNAFKQQVESVRRNQKYQFWMNAGTVKLCTIQSFKGWQVHTLILIITNENSINEGMEDDEFVTDELIYTGITRCICNLVIINIGNRKYHDFFNSHIPMQ